MKKSTGITRKLDELGRIVIPKEIRKEFNINEGDAIEIFIDKNSIVLKKYEKAVCKHCKLRVNEEDKFCKHCGEEL